MQDVRLVPLVRVDDAFAARVVAARLGSEGIVTSLRGAVDGPYPMGPVTVLVAADELRFKGATSVGDEVSVYVELLESGRTSLTYSAEAVSRERHGETETRVAWGRFKFVALDENDRPREIASA